MPPQDRLVSFVGFGVCGLVVCIVQERFAPDNQALSRAGAIRLYRMHALWATSRYVPWSFGALAAVGGGRATALDRALPVDDTRDLVPINAPSHMPVHFLGAMRRRRAQPSPRVDLLYGGMADLEIDRPDARSLELHVARAPWSASSASIKKARSCSWHLNLRHERREFVSAREKPVRQDDCPFGRLPPIGAQDTGDRLPTSPRPTAGNAIDLRRFAIAGTGARASHWPTGGSD